MFLLWFIDLRFGHSYIHVVVSDTTSYWLACRPNRSQHAATLPAHHLSNVPSVRTQRTIGLCIVSHYRRRRYLTDARCFIFQYGSPAHHACNAKLVTRHCNDFITKHEWPPNSPDLNLLDYHVWGAMLKANHKLDITSWTSKPLTIEELQTRLEMIWNNLHNATTLFRWGCRFL